jgi:AcrR family transcriptional regulator
VAASVMTRAPQGLDRAARAQMSEIQRGRLLAAAVDVVAEHGYGGMSVARVTGRAGVSRRTFYDLF